ncbi:MAG: SAM-dependent methyltransferase [Planctomycetota bacterium]|jgi:precorrin-6B methylase 2
MSRTVSITAVIPALAIALATGVPGLAADDEASSPDCVYVGTPYDVIDKMLEVASIEQDDLVYDLGCGDGRIMVCAAKRYGCRAVGYDVSPQRIEESHQNIRTNEVGHLVTVEKKDIFKLDLRPANVITLYLLPGMNKRLVPQLEKLRPGSRVVTHDYDIEGVESDKSFTVTSLEDGAKHYVYLYTAPLKKAADEEEEE